MSRPVTIALGQHDCVHGDRDANLEIVEKLMGDAAAAGADVLCLPELGGSGYRQDMLGDKLHELAEPVDGPTAQRLGPLAAELGLWVIVAIIEQGPMPGVVFNSVILIDRQGTVAGSYRKNHAYSTEGHYFAPGNQMPVFETDFGTIGLLICYDLGLPETARMMTLQGAEILFCPSAWCQEDEDIWDINIACRSLENRLFLAGVNRVGNEGETLVLFGKSKIAGPRGETLVEGKRFEEDLVIGTVDLDDVWRARVEIPYLKSRKPGTYELLSQVD